MNDQTYLILFRILHIGCSVFWTGSILYFALFIIPAVKSSGAEGTKFLQQLGKTGYPAAMMITALVAIFSGILLIWKLSNGFEKIWFTTLYARIIIAGMTTSVIAFVIGISVNRPSAIRINRISKAITAAGGTPTDIQIQELLLLRKKIFRATKIIAVLLVITLISMSIFRYVS